jgi:hypothetical protein
VEGRRPAGPGARPQPTFDRPMCGEPAVPRRMTGAGADGVNLGCKSVPKMGCAIPEVPELSRVRQSGGSLRPDSHRLVSGLPDRCHLAPIAKGKGSLEVVMMTSHSRAASSSLETVAWIVSLWRDLENGRPAV